MPFIFPRWDVMSAMFLISYEAGPDAVEAVQDAVESGLGLVVYSCDPNITSEMLAQTFQISPNAVKVMTTAARHAYKKAALEEESLGCNFGT